MAAFMTPEIINGLVTLGVSVLTTLAYHWTMGPTKPHPFLSILLNKVDGRTAAAVEATAEGVLDFVAGKGLSQPATSPASVPPTHP